MKLEVIWHDASEPETFKEKVNAFLNKHKVTQVTFIEVDGTSNAYILYEEPTEKKEK